MLTPHERSSIPLETSPPMRLTTRAVVARLSLLAWGGTACLACGKVTDTIAISTLAAPGAGAGEASSPGGGAGPGGGASAGGSAGAGPTTGSQCGDSYPQLLWPSDAPRTICTASFARDRMSHALCSCGDIDTWGGIRTEAFDSVAQTEDPGAAAVGINGAYQSPSILLSAGSLTVAASTPLAIPLLDVYGDLRLAGALDVPGTLTVKGDAWFADSVRGLSLVAIDGDVYQVPGKTLEATVPLGTKGKIKAEEFSVAPPCRCEETSISDWTSVIESAAEQNDNASIGLDATALAQPPSAIDLTLPCGRFYLSGIASAQDVRLLVVGRVALFVGGDVSSTGSLRVELETGAELDWFIGGQLDLASTAELGEAERPAATRIYLAGDGQLSVPQDYVFANLYAPRADVVLVGESDFFGSVFGRTVASLGQIVVHYDTAVQRVADGCAPEEPPSCSGCGECSAGRACIAGTCAACDGDVDCCWPLVCNGGRCSAFEE
jgi:hypothetical protein